MNTLSIALREMARRRRSIGTNLGIVLCVLSILVTVSTLREATMQRVRRVMAQMGNNLLFVPKDALIDNYYSARGIQAEMPEDRAVSLATRCPVMSSHATHYVAKFQQRVNVRGSEVIITGFHVIAGGHRPHEPKRRRSFLDDPLDPGHVIFGSEAARRTGGKSGDRIEIEGRRFTVKKVLPEFGVLDDTRVWARLEEIQGLFGKPDVIHGVDALGCMCAGPYFDGIKAEAARQVPELRLLHREVVARTRARSREAVEGVGAILLAVVAALGAVAVFATTAAEVRERRGEIGILLAMGAGRGRIFLLFLPKVLLVGVIGGILGWAFGTVLAVWAGPAVAGLREVPIKMLPRLLPMATVIGGVFALLASCLAIWRAARLDPIDALREL